MEQQDVVTCEFEGQFDRFLTEGEKYDLACEEAGVLSMWEDEDHYAEQDEYHSEFLLTALG